MFLFILILVVALIIFYCIKNNLKIDFKSFFKKGFKLNKEFFGLYCATGKQRLSARPFLQFGFINELRAVDPKFKVVTNVESYYERNKDFVIFNNNFYDIIEKFKNKTYNKNFIIFYDEIFALLDNKTKLNRKIRTFIGQLRKRKIYFITTAQEWLDINISFRRFVRYQIDCSMLRFPFVHTAYSLNVINDGYKIKWSNLENEYVAPIIKTVFKKCSLKASQQYDTYETIDDDSNQE